MQEPERVSENSLRVLSGYPAGTNEELREEKEKNQILVPVAVALRFVDGPQGAQSQHSQKYGKHLVKVQLWQF